MLRSAINHYYQGEFEKKKDIADILLCEPTCLHITSGRVCVCVCVGMCVCVCLLSASLPNSRSQFGSCLHGETLVKREEFY